MEHVELDPQNTEDAEILNYTSPSTELRRKKVLLGACILLTLFIIANVLVFHLSQ